MTPAPKFRLPRRPRRPGPEGVAFVCLVLVLILQTVVPPPWDVVVAAAAVATIVTAVVMRWVWPSPTSGRSPEETQPAGVTLGQMRRQVEDAGDGLQAAGFTEDEARDMVKGQMRAEAEKAAGRKASSRLGVVPTNSPSS